ncbi:hypothetical protein [Mycobacterium sp.]|uniref:hypothetical protein n=1 Tax=Mycobacterium sp. TaxID=1785 RepID=UPI003D0D33BF
MRSSRSRTGMWIGFGTAAVAFGLAATLSAATAPTARADDFSDILAAVDGDYAAGQTAFTLADSYFNVSGDFAPGLAELFYGLDDDVLGAPDNLLLGTVEALTGNPIDGSLAFNFGVPPDFTSGVADAEGFFNTTVQTLQSASGFLASGDYVDATYADLLGGDYFTIALQEFLIGAAVAF